MDFLYDKLMKAPGQGGLSKQQLKDLATSYGFDCNGDKAELCHRVLAFLRPNDVDQVVSVADNNKEVAKANKAAAREESEQAGGYRRRGKRY